MNFLPKASGNRPKVACEIAPGGVVAARLGEAAGILDAVAMEKLADGAIVPGLKPGNIADRVAVSNAVRKALEAIGAKPNTRNADIAIVIPDGACRVLLLDFDSLPNKLSEALPIVRFRLKKLVPFDADDAMVSFQIMSTSKTIVRVLAVTMPRDVLSEYETAAREAGFEPGAILPSTLASMAAVDNAGTALVVNAGKLSVTTAIQRDGILLLHRTVDLQIEPSGVPANMPAALFEPSPPAGVDEFAPLPLVSVEETQQEWAAQEPLPEHGRNPYADRLDSEAAAEVAVQNEDGITALPVPPVYAADEFAAAHGRGPGDIANSPYASPTLLADLSAESHNPVLVAPTSLGTLTDPAATGELTAIVHHAMREPELRHEGHEAEPLPAEEFADEVAQAVSVAAAYFEDTLAEAPSIVLSAGSLGANGLQRILRDRGVEEADGLKVHDLVNVNAIAADAVSSRVARGTLAGVLGALRS